MNTYLKDIIVCIFIFVSVIALEKYVKDYMKKHFNGDKHND